MSNTSKLVKRQRRKLEARSEHSLQFQYLLIAILHKVGPVTLTKADFEVIDPVKRVIETIPDGETVTVAERLITDNELQAAITRHQKGLV